jgi:hypothetical protein
MGGTRLQFQNGHSIRFRVTSSAFPFVAPNYDTGESMWEEKDPIIAAQTVYHSEKYPSRLILPEVRAPNSQKLGPKADGDRNIFEQMASKIVRHSQNATNLEARINSLMVSANALNIE